MADDSAVYASSDHPEVVPQQDDEPVGAEASGTVAEEEFLRLFAACQRRLHAYVLAMVFDPNVAADLLQETNLVLWKKFDQFKPGTNFFAWAREIARIAILRHRQVSSSRIASIDPHMLESLAADFSDSAQAESREEMVLGECLEKLRADDKQLILSRYTAGASVNGIAQRMNRPVNSVSQSLRRIRSALLECTQRNLKAETR